MISKSMTLLASTLVMNMELSPYVENYIKKILKRAEKSYMKCGRVVSNAFLEASKRYINRKIEMKNFAGMMAE